MLKNFILKPFKFIFDTIFFDKKISSSLLNVVLVVVFAKFFIEYSGSFLDFFSSEEAIWFNVILAYILIKNIQTPYFQPPKDIFLNTLSLFLLIITIKGSLGLNNGDNYIFNSETYFWVLISILVFLIFYSLYIIIDYAKTGNKTQNGFYYFVDKLVVKYDILFLLAILISAGVYKETYKIYLVIICYLIVNLGYINKIIDSIYTLFKKSDNTDKNKKCGKIYRFDEPSIIRVKLEDSVGLHDILYFKKDKEVFTLFPLYIRDNTIGKICTCLSFRHDTPLEEDNKIVDSTVYKTQNISYEEVREKLEKYGHKIIGFIVENSNIDYIKFEFIENDCLEEGDVVFFYSKCKGENGNEIEKQVFYQIINGNTSEESFNNSPIGTQIITAVQLGTIDANGEIRKFSWFPKMNSLVYKYNKDSCNNQNFLNKQNIFKIGDCSSLSLPVEIDIDNLITYHSAILGVTGTGKSTLAFKIIREVAKSHKVVCVDITGEYKRELKRNGISFMTIGNNTQQDTEDLSKKQFAVETGTYGSPNEKKDLKQSLDGLETKIDKEIENLINQSDGNIYLLEIPSIMNTAATLKITQMYLNSIFNKKKSSRKKEKILLVLEEAHTIIPEWNFVSQDDAKNSNGIVNSMSQIALQGRKYGVGLLVISQRTALVSKTILSQCNTFFTFSLIDNTSLDFLSNFYGKMQIDIIPRLKKYHLIAFGVAVKSERPIIINTEDKNLINAVSEEESDNDADDSVNRKILK